MVLMVTYHLLRKKYTQAALWFGLVVHFKIYPIIYAIPIYFYIDKERSTFFTRNRIRFTLVSASVFLFLTTFFYYLYGYECLYESLLYHLLRKDHRHNFSLFFYFIYLNYENISILMSIMTFLPQFTILVACGFKFYKDLPFCLFIQTYFFVFFNKVITA